MDLFILKNVLGIQDRKMRALFIHIFHTISTEGQSLTLYRLLSILPVWDLGKAEENVFRQRWKF